MSREVKFRARNANVPPCWIYGYFVNVRGECKIINNNGEFKVIAGSEKQFTGLKDKNGREIYEGDIVKFKNSIGQVVWRKEWTGFEIQTIRPKKMFSDEFYFCEDYIERNFEWNELEIIGNTYENPDLLKEGER
jgi:uncharacterized phage protein (TIGR01671 family)